jgi:DNA modification methylase
LNLFSLYFSVLARISPFSVDLRALNNGRKFIGIDQSNVAIKIMAQRFPQVEILKFDDFQKVKE